MQVTNWPIENVKPFHNNSRIHDEKSIKAITASVDRFSWLQPIVVDKDGVIVMGHGRREAALQLGMTEVPVLVADWLTDNEVAAAREADNMTQDLSYFDPELLAMNLEQIDWLDVNMEDFGFALDDAEYGDEADRAEEDDYEINIDEESEPMVKIGDVWQLGMHRLMCGDSTDIESVEKLMGGDVADLLLTDPPYNVALGHHMRPSEAKQLHRRTDGLVIDNDAFDSEQEFEDFLLSALESTLPYLKQGGAFYIWHASTMTHRFRAACDRAEIKVRQILVWNKNTFALGRQDYQWKHELCLYGWKDGAAHYFVDSRNKSTVEDIYVPDISKLKKADLLSLCKQLLTQAEKINTTVIDEDKPSRSEQHPTMKPIRLMARQIANSTQKTELVLDVFGGSGSTLIACEQLGRKCYMMELDPHYCDVIIDRWEKLTGKEAVRL